MNTTLDPITLEVLRHRLWMINDEQGRVAASISGSPVVYEAKDFNASLLTPDGDAFFVGVYTTRIALSLHVAAKTIIARYSDDPGYADGDAFVLNDPWAGASHMNDMLMVAPLYAGERLIGWSGISMHEVDVGGPNPGSFTVGTREVYGEGPLIPPVKLVERGRIRADVEAWVTRNSRTPELNGLDLRARLAAIERTRQRIGDVVAEYGVDTYLAAQQQIIGLIRQAFLRRLRELPDGTWREEGFVDHDGNDNVLYPIKLTLTKQGERMTFDFRGTSPQAPGSMNCTRVGLESGVLSAVFPMLCYDLPWSPAAILPALEIVSEEGTLNNASHPAAVSMATVGATYATSHIASAALGKLHACAADKGEAQANWTPAWQGAVVNGRTAAGARFTGVLLDQAGGGGASSRRDGVDSSGVPGSPAQGIANVEAYERLYPILYVYRKQSQDTGGAGRLRGGEGTEALIVPHGAEGPIDLTVISHGASQPEAKGLYGGLPSSVQVRLALRDAGVAEAFAAGQVPASWEELAGARVEPLAAKQRTLLGPGDAFVTACAGGGGYGDPLARDPARVAADVAARLCSAQRARDLYGVVLDAAGQVDAAATAARRDALRAERLREGRPAAALFGSGNGRSYFPIGDGQSDGERPSHQRTSIERSDAELLASVADAFVVIERDGAPWYACATCGHSHGPADADPKRGLLVRERSIAELSGWNRFGLVDEIVVREYYCPGCALLASVEVRRRGEPPLEDTRLALARPALVGAID